MAQVKKLQGGGNSPKYITIDQVKWYDTPENRKEWERLASQGDGAAQDILATLNDASYDNTASVTRQGDRVEFHNMKLTGLDDRGKKQLTKGSNFWRDNFGNKTKNSAVKRWLNFKGITSTNKEDEKNDDGLIDISTGSRRFSYDENGKYDQYLQSNANFLKILDQITDYFTLGREAGDKKYKFSGEGLDMDAMWSIYNNPNSPIDLVDFRRRILAGDVDDSDPVYRFLDPFFQGRGSTVTEDGQQVIADKKQADAWEEWSKRGFGNTADTKNFVYDSNSGKWVLNPNILTSLGLTANSGAWFNDNFIRNHYGYDFLKDKVLLNGNWYTTKDLTDPNSEAYKYLNSAQNDYYNKNRRGETDAADAVMMTSWGDKYESIYDPSLIGDLYNDKNIRVLKTNLATDNTTYDGIKLDPEHQVIKYINMQDQDLTGLGQRPIKYGIYDQYGNKVDIHNPNEELSGPRLYDYDINKFSGLYDYSTNKDDQHLSAYYRVSQDEDNPYYNAYELPSIKDVDGNELIKAWKVMGQGQHVAISPKFGGSEGLAFRNMPDDVYKMLTNSDFLNSVLSDRQLADSFVSLVNGTGKDENFDWAKGKKWRGKEIITKLADYFGKDNAENFVNYFLHSVRDSNYRIAQPKIYKDGGIIKKQSGGRFEHVGVKKQIPDKVVKLSQKAKGPIESKEIESFSDLFENLSKTDKKELSAIALDLGSALAGYTGVGDVVAIGGGLISNLMRYSVDRDRVKSGVSEKGTAIKNLLGRTALDAAALVPILGDTANTGSAVIGLVNFLKKNEKWTRNLSTAFLGAGLTSSASAVNKLISGETLTTDDIQSLATGLSSLTGLGIRGVRRIQDSTLASKIQNKPGEIKYSKKVGDKSIVLDNGDIRKITQASGKENIDKEFKNILKNKYNLSEDEIKNLTPEDFGFIYKGRKWWGKDSVSEKKQEKTKGTFRYILPNSNLRGDLKANVNNIKPEHLGSAANRLMRQYGISEGLGGDYTMTGKKRWVNPYPRTKAEKVDRNQASIAQPTTNRFNNSVDERTWSYFDELDDLNVAYRSNLPKFTYAPNNMTPSEKKSLDNVRRTRWLVNRGKNVSSLLHPYGKHYDDVVIMEKQGGILKGKYGLSFNDAKKSAFDKWGITKDAFNPKPYTITAPVEQNVEETIPSVTKSTVQQTGTTNSTTSGNGSLGFEFDKNQFASAALEAGNFIRGWNETNKVKDIYNRKSQALLNTQASHLPEVGMRFQNPIHSQYDRNISDLYHRTGMNAGTTSDAKLQAAMFSDANNTAMNYRTQQNQAMSDAWTNYQNQNLQNRQKYAQANWEIDQQNAQKRYAVSDLKLTGEADTLSQRSQMQDKLFNKIQGMLYRQGMVDSNIEGQKYQINLAKANALATNKDANVSGYDSMLKTLNSKDYKKYMSNKAYYGTLSAAKGGKLRPTSEQMLLDNQKLVAKAIEKMNDNTMKLILKALS